MKKQIIELFEGFRRILSLIQPVGNSQEIWLKLEQNKFIVSQLCTLSICPGLESISTKGGAA